MRFPADESFPGAAVEQLVQDGHNVAWVRTAAPGATDAEIIAWAAREERVLLTFDKDFGELALHAGLPSTSGVVLFRLPMQTAADSGAFLAARVGQRSDWAGNIAVIEPGRIRMRPIKPR